MSVLDSIIEGVREDLAARRKPLAQLQEAMDQAEAVRDPLSRLLSSDMSVIAEVKRSSPSKGALAAINDPAGLAEQYESAGATIISVLTEQRRFGGSLTDLDAVRSRVNIPILRKDFMVDEYQFFEARAHGADLVLLIVAALSQSQLNDFHQLSEGLGMRALVEVHTNDELERALEISPSIIGVNSRNLKTLDVDAQSFAELIPRIPRDVVRVAESGISTRKDVEFAQSNGATAILVGEALVRAGDPALAMRELLGLDRLGQ
ncbi:MAG: indole-3-glycerol phosphate synthase TrpC [Actinobacteria bacterium]|uniref:indole-3-glycerol-phosphate synthase n=1 Tax=freshwater metagenome TaxID=449393 RepID=A0A6J5YYS4_9ZZZZ|nr:indole-3-glycerol phosphate synthase TrpC [Actinomycetota bacterium]MSX71675.1 indole-3-glycerol phosphate synthase TrpC [Actinomycetota bacterium]MSY69106.1 indole-3-glycerol phosphate synthase TrpC [Actinomycetota bacterium]MTA75674.1 indole-3-glycerol phosphate synthase TrpC [Actinomycetota bacterium]